MQPQPKLWAKWESREVFAGFPSKAGKSVFDFSALRLFHSFSRGEIFTIARYTLEYAFPDTLWSSKDELRRVVPDVNVR